MKFNKFFGICALASGIALAGCGGSQTPAEQPKADAKTDAKAETKTADKGIITCSANECIVTCSAS